MILKAVVPLLPPLLLAACAAPEPIPFAERALEVAPVAYDLAFDVDFQEPKLRGSGRLTVRNTSDHAVRHLPLLLYRMMKVTELTAPDGTPLRFTERILPYEDWEQLQVNYVEVTVPPIDPGEERTIAIAWEGYLYGYTEAMRYVRDRIDPAYTSLREETKVYPVVGYPSWRVNRAVAFPTFDAELRVTVPDTLVVANGGELVDVAHADGRATYHYRSLKPSWRLDIGVAPYEMLERGGLRIFHFAEEGDGAEMVAGAFLRAIDQFTAWLGPLHDFGGYTIIEVPDGYGSQADVAHIMLQAAAFHDPDQLTQLYHEASHLWNVRLAERPSPRWEEGLASFHQQLLLSVFAGDERLGAVEGLAARLRERLRDQFAREPRLGQIPPIAYGEEDVTDLSYRVGMLMFGVLYRLIGPDAFHELVGGFYQDHHATGASTDDFVARAKSVTSVNLDPFFQDWLYGTGYTRFLDGDRTLAQIADTYR